MNQSNEIKSKIKSEFIRLLDYYIHKIDYSKQLSASVPDSLDDLFETLRQSEKMLLEVPSASVKAQIEVIQRDLDPEQIDHTIPTQQDFLEELELFKIRYNLED